MASLPATRIRALAAGPAFWAAMFMASAFGANLGDYAADLAPNRPASFALMAAICLLAMAADRVQGLRTELFYWVAIVALRAAATNLADAITHDLHASYAVAALALAALTLLAGAATSAPRAGLGSPLIDARYWLAMFLAGLCGTVAGDLASHTAGLYAASATLVVLLLLLLAARARLWPGALLAYWAAVLAERSAATPVADMLESPRALDLGLPAAMAITLSLFLAALLLRRAVGPAVTPALDPARAGAPD